MFNDGVGVSAHTQLQALVEDLQEQARRDAVDIATLQTALKTARRIGAAIGIVMATTRCTEQAAFDLLVRSSQHQNRKLRDVADDVVSTGEVPR